MTCPIVFRRPARAEFDEAALWYEARRPELGARFVAEVARSIVTIHDLLQARPVGAGPG